MLDTLNQNAGAVTALVTFALLLVTGFYAWTTYKLVREARITRVEASTPRVVSYLRIHPVHTNIVQLCIANLSSAAAAKVTFKLDRLTSWPEDFYLQDSTILRDLRYLRPNEIVTFDLGMGPDLFSDGDAARFRAIGSYEALDGRSFSYTEDLDIVSVAGHSHFRIYGLDDIARHLDTIKGTLKSVVTSNRLRVESYDAEDRRIEREAWESERRKFQEKQRAQDNSQSE